MKTMLFLNVGWMKEYQGLSRDTIKGGGAFVKEYDYGHEIENFKPYKGYMFGYASPTRGTIKIERLGGSIEDDSIDNVLLVWVSKSPLLGRVIIGWYKHATVYRKKQLPSSNSKRRYNNELLEYYVKAKKKNCRLLPMDRRIFNIPSGSKGMGQSNVWYADKKYHTSTRKEILDFISRDGIETVDKLDDMQIF